MLFRHRVKPAENIINIITDLWANVLQIGIAIYLLERQVGAVCIAPVILAIGKPNGIMIIIHVNSLTCLAVSTLVTSKFSSFVTTRQKVWLEAIQQRVNFTSESLGSMKSVKMLGLTDKIGSIMQAMRERELR